ncbi:MAG: hypothetical protein M3461_12155 [Pseudomonadota bacterium]|nr:hypothetical protein [Pseudomonadota bacterium]
MAQFAISMGYVRKGNDWYSSRMLAEDSPPYSLFEGGFTDAGGDRTDGADATSRRGHRETQAGARQTLAANPLPPMALDEIQAEMDAYQAERRAGGRSRGGWCWMPIQPGCYGTARRHN